MVDETKPTPPPVHGEHLLRPRRRICLQIIIAASILFSGIVIGAGGTILLLKDKMIWKGHHGAKKTVDDIVEELRSEYNLTEEQTSKVKGIHTRAWEARETLRQDIEQKVAEEHERLIAEMKEALSPEQFEQWERDLRERMERFQKRRPPQPKE
jgi:hypothetical protein